MECPHNRLTTVEKIAKILRGEIVGNPMYVDCIGLHQRLAPTDVRPRGWRGKIGAFGRDQSLGTDSRQNVVVRVGLLGTSSAVDVNAVQRGPMVVPH
jgi:hypothetical protein